MEGFRCPASAMLFPLSVFVVIAFIFLSPSKEQNYQTLLLSPLVLSTIKTSPLLLQPLEFLSNFTPANESYINNSIVTFESCTIQGPKVSHGNRELFKSFIRALCNANTSEGFQPKRDVSIPEVYIPKGKLGPPRLGLHPNNRTILAFFAGGVHADIRQTLLQHWKDNDTEVQVHEYLPKDQNYNKLMGQSKFCLCLPSPRVVEAIHAGCVPVIICDNYSLPFSDVLNWSQFSMEIPVKKIPEIKRILKRVSRNKYLRLHMNVLRVRRHFMINRPVKPYDMMHMILHSLWLRRLNFKLMASDSE